jgi:hypothetical protein
VSDVIKEGSCLGGDENVTEMAMTGPWEPPNGSEMLLALSPTQGRLSSRAVDRRTVPTRQMPIRPPEAGG